MCGVFARCQVHSAVLDHASCWKLHPEGGVLDRDALFGLLLACGEQVGQCFSG